MDSNPAEAVDATATTQEVQIEEAVAEGSDEEPENVENAEDAQKSEQDKGKDAYNKGNYEEAIKAWSLSLKSVKYMLDKGCYKEKPEQLEEVHQIKLRLNLNMAQGSLKIRDWRGAIEYADKVLECDAHHTKALYRKAEALIGLGQLKECIAVLDIFLRIDPENPAAKDLKAKTARNLALADRKDSRAAKKMFASLEKDPRVAPSSLESLVLLLRNAPSETKRYFGELWEWAWEASMDALYSGINLAFKPWNWLRGMVSQPKARSKVD